MSLRAVGKDRLKSLAKAFYTFTIKGNKTLELHNLLSAIEHFENFNSRRFILGTGPQ